MSEDGKQVGIRRRRLFGPHDDKRLEQIIKENKFTGWKNVAKMMPGFTPKQLRDRWHNYISPNNSFEPWTFEEDKIIVQKVQQFGTKWSQISSYLPGRSDNCIKNRWNTVLKDDFMTNPHKYYSSHPEEPKSFPTESEDTTGKPVMVKSIQTVSNVFLDERFIEKFFETSKKGN